MGVNSIFNIEDQSPFGENWLQPEFLLRGETSAASIKYFISFRSFTEGSTTILNYLNEDIPKGQNSIIYYEADELNNFLGTAVRIRLGKYTRNALNRRLGIDEFAQAIVRVFQRDVNATGRSKDLLTVAIVKTALEDELSREKTGFINILSKLPNPALAVLLQIADEAFDGAIGFFDDASSFVGRFKFDKNQWNPLDDDGGFSKTYDPPFLFNNGNEMLSALDIASQTGNGVVRSLGFELKEGQQLEKILLQALLSGDKEIRDLLKRVASIDNRLEQLISGLYTSISDEIQAAFSETVGVVNDFFDTLKEQAGYANAFLCGLINGVLDLVQGIINLIGLLIKAIAGNVELLKDREAYYQLAVEFIEEIAAALKKVDLKVAFTTYVVFVFAIWSKLAELILDNDINPYVVSFILGIVIFEVIGFLLPPLKFGKIGKLGTILEDIFGSTGKLVAKTQSKGKDFIDELAETFQNLIKLLGDNRAIKEFFEKLGERILKWADDIALKSIKELSEKISINITKRINTNKDKFILLYTKIDINKLVRTGRNLGLEQTTIEDFIFVGSRIKKRINIEELLEQMNNWAKIVKPRGYPFLFKNLSEFKRFGNELKNGLSSIGLSVDNVRIQGSSLRTPNANDIDIAVFIDDAIFNSFLRKAFVRKIKLKLNDEIIDIINFSDDSLNRLANDIKINPRNYNSIARTFRDAFLNRKISSKTTKPRIIEGLRDFRKDLLEKYSLEIDNISILTKNGSLDIEPSIKIN